VDVLLYAMGRLQLCIPWRLDRYVQLAHQLEFQQHDATTASLMSTAFIDSTAAASGSEAVTSTPDITPPQYDLFNDDLLMVKLDDVDACFVDVRKSERYAIVTLAAIATLATRRRRRWPAGRSRAGTRATCGDGGGRG